MKLQIYCKLTFVLVFLFYQNSNLRADITPRDCGWDNAKSDIERLQVLYDTHKLANDRKVNVDYTNMGVMNLEIPNNFYGIPIGDYTDFKGATINIKNFGRDAYLFRNDKKLKPIKVSIKNINSGIFTSIPELAFGNKLLIIEDSNIWSKRIGYSSQENRKDLLLISNGIAQNNTILKYISKYSNIKCSYCDITTNSKVLKNLTINRNASSSKKTYLLYLVGINNFNIQNVTVNTPQSNLTGDLLFTIKHCSNLHIDNVLVNNTYSSKKDYGYAFKLENLWNCTFNNLRGYGNWGIFGSNNINTATLNNCDINRFDLHSYGKDITITNSTFSNLSNPISSMYGTFKFSNCIFTDFCPIQIRPEYNAFTPFDIIIENCIWNVSKEKNYLVLCSTITTESNPREELKDKCIPNIFIDGLQINSRNIRDIYILYQEQFSKGFTQPIQYMSSLHINNLHIDNPTTIITATNKEITSAKRISTKMPLNVIFNIKH